MMIRCFCVCLNLFLLTALFSNEIPYSKTPVMTDENLFNDFEKVAPDDRQPESLPTRCWLWYDEDALHVMYNAEIDGTFKAGQYYPRDNGSDGDYLRLQLITIPEAYYAYYYVGYPTGNLYDAVRNSNLNTDTQWNSSYSYQTEYSDSLWTLHFTIPFRDLRFNAHPPYDWKIILTRYNKEMEETFSCPYVTTKMDKYYFTNAQDITLTQQIKRASDFKFKPYFVKSYDMMTRTDTFDPENLGMDISFSPGTKTKLKIALNPDFTDIPPDNAQNDYNSKYPPWYSENRFFFTEDLDAFMVDYSMFYTRYIVQPQLAVKLTGNRGILNYGVLGAKDKKITDNGSIVNYDDYYLLGSMILTLPWLSTSVSSASRLNKDYLSQLAIGYWKWEYLKDLYVGQSATLSYKNPRPGDYQDTKDLTGYLGTTFIQANPGNWDAEIKYLVLTDDFRADMGTVYETGYESLNANVSWNADEKERYVKSWGFYTELGMQNQLDDAHTLQGKNAYTNAWFSFKPKYSCSTGVSLSQESYEDKLYDQWSYYQGYNWYKYDAISLGFNPGIGRNLVYSLYKTYPYNNLSLSAWGVFNQKMDWSLSLTQYNYAYPRTSVIVVDADTLTVVRDNHYQIGSAKLNYNFTNELTLRNGVSITSYDADGDYARMSFYSNFRYEFRRDCFLYIGYKTGQAQDEESSLSDMLGHFQRNSASGYLKVSLTL